MGKILSQWDYFPYLYKVIKKNKYMKYLVIKTCNVGGRIAVTKQKFENIEDVTNYIKNYCVNKFTIDVNIKFIKL